jgi:hypothetical protein
LESSASIPFVLEFSCLFHFRVLGCDGKVS